jgi:hypothetical protein
MAFLYFVLIAVCTRDPRVLELSIGFLLLLLI